MPTKRSGTSKRPRRRKIPIEPIHVEELLGGAGMSGFLGVLDPPVAAAHLERLAREGERHSKALCRFEVPSPGGASEISAKVASVVLKVEALSKLMQAKSIFDPDRKR